MDQNEFFWNLYQSEREFQRHHENQRTTASNILAAIAAGLIVGFGSSSIDYWAKITISIMLMVLGLFGYIFCRKLTSLIKLHGTRSYEYLKIVDESLGEHKVSVIKKKADQENKRLYLIFSKMHLSGIWSLFHLFIFFVGFAFAAYQLEAFLPAVQKLFYLFPLPQK